VLVVDRMIQEIDEQGLFVRQEETDIGDLGLDGIFDW